MAGRKPKPTELKVVQGTFRKDRAKPREAKASGDLKDCPVHFGESQKEVWDYAIAHAPKGLLKNLDCSVLEIWVVAYVFHREAAKQVAIEGQIITAPSGYPITNPYMSNMNRQAQIMLKASSEMGFTPSSRSRISVDPEISIDDPWEKLAKS